MVRLHSQHTPAPGAPHLQSVSETLDSLVIIDRRVDMITPMLTQLTYEGLIDECIGIKNSKLHSRVLEVVSFSSLAFVQLPANIVSPPAPGPAQASTSLTTTPVQAEKKKKYQLSSSTDPLFVELRDINFAVLGGKLSSIAHRLKEDYDVRIGIQLGFL